MAVIVRGKEGIAVPAASAALALDHNHDSREPDSQASLAPSAPTPAPAPKKRGRPRITPPEALSPFARWVAEERGGDSSGVANELGITRNHLYHLMNGSRNITIDLAKKIVRASGGKLSFEILLDLNSPDKTIR